MTVRDGLQWLLTASSELAQSMEADVRLSLGRLEHSSSGRSGPVAIIEP